MSIAEKVYEYNQLRSKAKIIKSRMDEIAKEIKTHLTSNFSPDAKGSYYTEDENFIYGNQAKKSIKLNEERAKLFFQENNLLEEVSEVKIVINEDKVSKLLDEGKITQEELETLVDIKVSYSIDIKEKKKEEVEEEMPVINSVKPVKRKLPVRR